MNEIKRPNISKYVKYLPGAIVIAFLVIFAFNLFQSNAAPADDAAVMDANIEKVAAIQKADVDNVEKDVNALDAKEKLSSSKSTKAMYQRMFKDCVVIGDSLTEGLKVYGWLNKKQVYSLVGASVISSKDMLKSAAKKKPKYAFLAFGMNDLIMFRKDPDGFIKEYKKKLDYFHKKSPDTKIVICGISAPSKDAIKRQKSLGKYKKFNQNLKKMAKKRGYGYVRVSDILENNHDLYGGDGIHAKSAYYPHWLNRMAEEAGLSN